MTFISLQFAIFFCIVVPLYFALPQRLRIPLLLISSYVFYAFSRVEYVLLIAFSTVVDYIAAREISKTDEEFTTKRRFLLGLSIFVNLGVLFLFKYFNFFNNSVEFVSTTLGYDFSAFNHQLILPVGISFYTFQSMAYTIDVYRGRIEVENRFTVFATYVAFFPQLVAGPIERAHNMLPQFHRSVRFDYERVVSGLRLILWGVFKKVVIADRLAVYVNSVYNDLDTYSGLPLIVATVFFSFQIYCDFSGYSDIAIGVARVMGYDLMENFRSPYFAESIRDFWRRWHISLSTWFRDYVYIPLGGNRVSVARNLLNLMIVFVVSGLWHGANWTFVVWGALHGVLIVFETIVDLREKSFHIPVWIRRIMTFALVTFAWIFFRANSTGDALYVIQNLLDFSDGTLNLLRPLFGIRIDVRVEFILSSGLILFLLFVEWSQLYSKRIASLLDHIVLRWTVYYAAAYLILFSLSYQNTSSPFIYFQF